MMAESDVLQKMAEEDFRRTQSAQAAQRNEKALNALAPIQPTNTMIPAEHSEQALARLFAARTKDRLRYVRGWGWTAWNGKVWIRGAFEEAAVMCMEYAEAMLAEALRYARDCPDDKDAGETAKWAMHMRSAKAMRSMIELSRPLLLTDMSEFDAGSWVINTKGGLVDLKTGAMRPHDAKDMCSMMCSVDPSKTKDSDQWGDFLRAVTCDDAELEHYLHLLFGMAMVGKVYQEGIAIFYGGGSNGKSTLVNPIRKVLGSYATTLAPEILMASRNRDEVRGLAGLRGKRLVIASETEEGQRLSASVVKRLASTDQVNARELYHEAFDYEPTHTLIMFTNFLPKISGTDNGIWRRIHAVPFEARFGQGGNVAVPNYGDVLFEECGADILAWLIEGACMYHKNGMRLPDAPACVREGTQAYRTGEDWIGNFIQERCEMGPGYNAAGGQLYAAYRVWAQSNGEYVRRNRDFAAALETNGFTSKRTKLGALWQGIKLLPSNDYYQPWHG